MACITRKKINVIRLQLQNSKGLRDSTVKKSKLNPIYHYSTISTNGCEIHPYIYIHTYIDLYIYLSISISISIYIYVFIYTNLNTQVDSIKHSENHLKPEKLNLPGTTFAMFATRRLPSLPPSTASASGVQRSRPRPGVAVAKGRRLWTPRQGVATRREAREARERGAEVKKPYICGISVQNDGK